TGGMERCAAEIGAADHSDFSGGEWLARQPLDQIIAVVGFGAILEAAAGAERRPFPTDVRHRYHVTGAKKRAQCEPVFEGCLPHSTCFVFETSPIRCESEYHGPGLGNHFAGVNGTVNVDG